jgi:uncharacterized membrane protein YjfL (UPF0719 family)
MDWGAVMVGVAELLLAFVLGLLTVWLAFRSFAKFTRSLDEMQELRQNNVALGILLAAIVFSTAFIVRTALYPSISTWQTLIHRGFGGVDLLFCLGITLFSFVFSAMLALVSIWSALRIFMWLTREIDEFHEISHNNTAIAIVLGTLIVVMGLFLSHGVQSLLSAMIPMPSFERIQVMGMP